MKSGISTFNTGLLRQSIKSLTQTLAESNVEVTCSGLSAYTTLNKETNRPELINVPSLPDDCSEELLNAVQGYLDREVGKVLFADYDVHKRSKEIGGQFDFFFKIVDCLHTDGKLKDRYRGSGLNLRRMLDYSLEHDVTKKANVVIDAGSDLTQDQYNQAIAGLIPSALRALSGDIEDELYMDNGYWPIVEKIVGKFDQPILDRLKNVPDSQ